MRTRTGSPRTRLFGLIVVVLAIAAGVSALAITDPWQNLPATSGESLASAALTAPAEKGTLTNKLRLNATLGYGEPVELPSSQGVITALPASGQVIGIGNPVYESNGRPVVLLEGARPLWRELSAGIEDGQDILQLEQNLARLGFFGRTPDTRFDRATADAVRRWQKHLGVPETGTVAIEDVVVVNAPSIRVSQVTGRLGQTGASPGTYTAGTLRATAKLTPAQARELTAGTPVTVALPDGTELDNTIAAVDPGGQPTGEANKTTPPTALVEFPDQDQVTAIGPASIRIVVQNAEESAETIIVPAAALIATAKDAYAVEVLTNDTIVRVPVQIGLIADSRVQIVASGSEVKGAATNARALTEGDAVVISR